MSVVSTQFAIIGGGLAAHTAANVLLNAGAEVAMIYPKSPGATALWSGLGQAFGPSTASFPESTGLVGLPSSPTRPVVVDRQERWNALVKRREFHPYRRVGLGRSEVAETLARAVDALAYPGLTLSKPELVLPSPAAAPYPVDLAAASVLDSAVARGERVGVLACPALVDWHPDRLVEALGEAADAAVVEADFFSNIAGRDQHSVKVAAQLDAAVDGQPGAIAGALADLAQAEQLDLLIVPPVLGRTWQAHDAVMDELHAALPCRVAELAAARHSIHGWRLDRFLRSHTEAEVVTTRAVRADIEDGTVTRIETEDGAVEARALVLATGRWISGGLPRTAPFVEPILGVDLWLDGGPIPNASQTWPPNLLERHVWEDHPLFRSGVATDQRLRPLDHRGEPVADNVFAAGRMLAGTNPFWDGTTEGVDLVTGLMSARYALARLDLSIAGEEVA